MNKSAKTVFIYGLYIFFIGWAFALIPNTILGLFGFDPTNEVWIRALGFFSVNVGAYYLYAAYTNLKPFFWMTVFGRTAFLIELTLLVVLGFGKPMLILFGALDFISAMWTLDTLRAERN